MTRSEVRQAIVESLFVAHRRSGRVLHMLARSGMAAGDLTFPRVLLLRTIATRGRSSSRDLAAVMGVTTANLPGLLDGLETDGFVTRKRDAKDRRIVYVEATPAGRRKLKELWRAGMSQVTKEFESWSERDLVTLRELLTRVALAGCGPRRRSELVMIQQAQRRGR